MDKEILELKRRAGNLTEGDVVSIGRAKDIKKSPQPDVEAALENVQMALEYLDHYMKKLKLKAPTETVSVDEAYESLGNARRWVVHVYKDLNPNWRSEKN